MGYRLMVYDREKTPEDKEEFQKWLEKQMMWKQDHDPCSLEETTDGLRQWFLEMTGNFPPVNGAFAPTKEAFEQDETRTLHLTDYFIGRDMICASVKWDVAKQARDVGRKLSMVYDLGFFEWK